MSVGLVDLQIRNLNSNLDSLNEVFLCYHSVKVNFQNLKSELPFAGLLQGLCKIRAVPGSYFCVALHTK